MQSWVIQPKDLAALGCKVNSNQRIFTLAQYRKQFIPAEGLWDNYFHCVGCGWERRTIAYCKYCEQPMVEIGCKLRYLKEEKGINIFRADLTGSKEVSDTYTKPKTEQREVVGKVNGVEVFKVEM